MTDEVTHMNATTATKVRVWDVPTRVFHWLLAGAFLGAWLTGDSERWRDIHVLLGYTMLGLIGFRLVWGLVGSRYARFSAFLYGPGRVLRYLDSLRRGRPEHYLGHNPAGSLAIFALLGLGILTTAAGYATYQELGGDWLEEAHELAANAMLLMVAIHLLGVVVSSVLHRENLARAMVTGDKEGASGDGIRRSHAWLGAVLLAAVAAFWYAYPQDRAATGDGAAAWVDGQRHEGRHRHHDDD